MALQRLTVTRRPLLTTIASMDDVVREMGKEVEENGYTIVTTDIQFDAATKQCTVQINAEKRGK